MEITFRQVHSAAAFRNKRMLVGMFTTRRVKFQSRPISYPHRRDPGMVQRSCKFIQASDAFPTCRNQPIDTHIDNARRLAQAKLQSAEIILCVNPQLSEVASRYGTIELLILSLWFKRPSATLPRC